MIPRRSSVQASKNEHGKLPVQAEGKAGADRVACDRCPRTASFVRDLSCRVPGALLAIALLLAVFFPFRPHVAWAEGYPVIAYDGGSDELVFVADEETDLFDAFKGLVPGDTRTQVVSLNMRNLGGEARVYVRAETDAATARLLAPLALTVEVGGRTVESTDMADAFAKNVLVATFAASDVNQMLLTLGVPTSVGNELADAQPHVKWFVTVEEEDGTGATAVFPPGDAAGFQRDGAAATIKTGDPLSAGVAVVSVAVMLAAGLAVLASRRRSMQP